jgi:hypothetical protein
MFSFRRLAIRLFAVLVCSILFFSGSFSVSAKNASATKMKAGQLYTCNGSSCSASGNPGCSVCCPTGHAAMCSIDNMNRGHCYCQ